jgi:hypothetical protein
MQNLIGPGKVTVVDASAADAAVEIKVRAIKVDSDGIIKIDLIDESGTAVTRVENLAGGVYIPYVGTIKKVYKQSAAETDCTGTVLKSDGTEVIGLKLVHG